MDLHTFPFDSQQCSVFIQSYSMPAEKVDKDDKMNKDAMGRGYNKICKYMLSEGSEGFY